MGFMQFVNVDTNWGAASPSARSRGGMQCWICSLAGCRLVAVLQKNCFLQPRARLIPNFIMTIHL